MTVSFDYKPAADSLADRLRSAGLSWRDLNQGVRREYPSTRKTFPRLLGDYHNLINKVDRALFQYETAKPSKIQRLRVIVRVKRAVREILE